MIIAVAPIGHKVALIVSLSLNALILLYLTFYSPDHDQGFGSLLPEQQLALIQQQNSGSVQNFIFECDRRTGSKSDLMNTKDLQASGDLAGSGLAYREVSPGVLCYDKDKRFKQGGRGDYWVLYNFVPARKDFRCNESMTYTTHGDFTFFDNLDPLLERWQGPLSLAVYAPGTDYNKTIESIIYYRECTGRTLVKDFVTFHIYFELTHIPKDIVQYNAMKHKKIDCSSFPKYTEGFPTYKKENDLTYPVNVARNVAREMAQTHFIFPSDIELYPSPNLIPTFLAMIKRDNIGGTKPRVYVNHIFEIEKDAILPNNKKDLVTLLDSGVVIPFHKQVCPSCHQIPQSENWVRSEVKPGMNVFHVGKRQVLYNHWEPIFIGTNSEPWYEERLSWEGRSDKMSQGYKLCLLDYEFHILDNAFLIHRPGIKTKQMVKHIVGNQRVSDQNKLLRSVIYPEIQKLYGKRFKCQMFF